MTDADRLTEEVSFLTEEIRSLKSRIGATGNATQLHKLKMLERLLARCERALRNIEGREA